MDRQWGHGCTLLLDLDSVVGEFPKSIRGLAHCTSSSKTRDFGLGLVLFSRPFDQCYLVTRALISPCKSSLSSATDLGLVLTLDANRSFNLRQTGGSRPGCARISNLGPLLRLPSLSKHANSTITALYL